MPLSPLEKSMRVPANKNIVVRSFTLMVSMFFFGGVSYAQDLGPFADQVCDPGYNESINSKAWLEAQREVIQHQNLIFKPDSVLEYTCFDSSLNHVAKAAKDRPLFSSSDRWGAAAGNMAGALQPIAASNALWDTTNFGQDLLGGRKTGDGYKASGQASARDYECDTMDRVWEVAKCMGFIGSPENDGFFTFAQYVADPDKRFLPEPCQVPNVRPQIKTKYEAALIEEYTPWVEEKIATYFDVTHPPEEPCGDVRAIVGTGLDINVASNSLDYYKEHVCLIPGCYYAYGDTYTLSDGPKDPASEPSGECVLP